MLTQLGRVLRKIRIDNDEILKNMSDRFGVTASYLSAVENGKRPAPEAWQAIIVKSYELDDRQREELKNAFIDSVKTVPVDVSKTSLAGKQTAFAFARQVADLSEDQLEKIRHIMGGA